MLEKNEELMYKKSLIFSVKLASSISSKGWSVTREAILPIIPKLSYETECDIIVDGVHAKARLNLEPRLFYRSTQKELIKSLEKLIEEGKSERIEVEMLLNQQNPYDVQINKLFEDISKLKKENEKLKSEIALFNEKNKKINSNLKELSKIINDN